MKTILLSSVSVAILLTTLPAASDAQWIQCKGLQNFSFTGFGTSGNSLIAGVSQWGGLPLLIVSLFLLIKVQAGRQ
jgi:hypothetical protein